MNFHDKVILVIGGGYGIGASCVEEFLKRDVKGVVIADADIDQEFLKKLSANHNDRKFAFVKVDAADKNEIENAFKETIAKYSNIDVLINAFAIFNEFQWEKVIQINLVNTAHSCFLAINKYFPNHKSGSDAYIVNIISLSGIIPIEGAPHYTASRHGVVGLTRSYGLNRVIIRNGICIMGICQGLTNIPLARSLNRTTVFYDEYLKEGLSHMPIQEPEVVAIRLMEILGKPEGGSIWVVSDGVLSKVDLHTLEEWKISG